MRIIAFGCSNTYGHGLEDCWDQKLTAPGPEPSKIAWPALLAKKFNCDVVNKSKPGASNKFIWQRILDFNFQTDDVCVVLWSYLDRWCVFSNVRAYSLSIGNEDDRKGKAYYKNVYEEKDHWIMSTSFMYTASLHLKENNITTAMCYHDQFDKQSNYGTLNKYNLSNLSSIDYNYYKNKYPLALDKAHMGPKAHERFAEIYYKKLRKQI